MLRFLNLGSGSSGNATLIQVQRPGGEPGHLLVDCGLSQRSLDERLARVGLSCQDLDAVFITHEHADHIGSAPRLAPRLGLPVWMSQGTLEGLSANSQAELTPLWRRARDEEPIDVLGDGSLVLWPFTVPHDAREPLQLRCEAHGQRLGILTDLGHASSHVVRALQDCDALLLEANHCPDLLARSSYPPFLRRRISGPLGHLANAQTAELLGQLLHSGLNQLVLAHLSEQNNGPALALLALQGLNLPDTLGVQVASPGGMEAWCTARAEAAATTTLD